MGIELKLVTEDRDSGNYLRSMDYRVGSGAYSRLLPTWRSGTRLPPKAESWWAPLSEVYARITLDELRTIDSDADQQREFIRSYLTPTPGTVGLPIINVLVAPDDRVLDKDIEYLAALSCPPGCASSVAPLLYEYHVSRGGRPIAHAPADVDRYLDFIERFVTFATSMDDGQIQLTLPSNFPFSRVGRLLEIFKDVDTPLLVVDAFGLTVREKYAQVKKAIGIGEKGTPSLREKNGERFAVYAFDTKHSTGRGPTVGAQRLVQVAGGYSCFGPLRTNRTMVTKGGPTKPGRVFVPSEIAYSRPHVPGATADFKVWCAANGITYSPSDSALRAMHTLHGSVRVAKEMADWAARGELTKHLASKKAIQSDLKTVRRSNGRMFSTQTKLF